MLELGLPYSDPVMDGPVIQEATQRRSRAGFRLADGFEAVRRITARVDAPVLIMTYWNPVVQYGVDRFADDLAARRGSRAHHARPHPRRGRPTGSRHRERTGLDRVFLAAPTSTDARIRQAVDASRGFVYAVSTMGITGARSDVDAAARTLVARLSRRRGRRRAASDSASRPPAQVAEVLEYADGAIVGSALVNALADGGVAGGRRAGGRARARHAPRVKYADSGLRGRQHEERQ